MSNAPTLNDVARAVGVTHMTVSRSFSGKGRVAESTRQRVFAAAAALGYRPNAAAAATRNGRTGYLGMIRSPELSRSVHAPEFDAGLDHALHERGLCLLRDVIDSPLHRGDDDARAPRIVRENAVDGLLINYVFGTPATVRDLIDRCHIPSFWINRKRESNCVHPADEGAALEATRFVLDHGHRSAWFVDRASEADDLTSEEHHYSVADRRVGYARAMRERGLKPRIETLRPRVRGVYAPGRLFEECVRMLQRPDRPTAMICSNEHGRVMAMAALSLSLRLPEDLSLITFDNHAASGEDFALDRVLTPHFRMGAAAVAELTALIGASDTPRSPVVLPFEFHRTGSVARSTRA
ncbi:LacI family DNA-binding transcriptional regulator [Phycisphaera mikurensis]|uniref:Putative LacI family transcriptional regulator n=1 Tax=Phycisphaera mikurensis (strain NBRC 102666 / KCTC 22515 / FYK2301M01) TaxID=1142394 RepID=I0ICY7_PHYMF|nr:LacI family DNA-binding transcriptional regulator [Phycisphaera mikurensis]MBB6442255.1 LacI family transcriptional regulator [Phycisphaera mikurensis]BAM03125.1 putative LacI family transcriptional regulator [Phycisphaera mikurensis NBRC 102666]